MASVDRQEGLTGGEVNSFYTEKPQGKFVALFADGSGASLFMAVDSHDGLPAYVDHEGDLVPEPETYFVDAGYDLWFPLPDDFKMWFEQVPV